MKTLWIVLIVALLTSSILLPLVYFDHQIQGEAQNNEVYFGVTFGMNTTSEAKTLIDKVQNYTNLFIVDSWPIATNETALNEVCDYAVSKDLNIIVYFSYISHDTYPWHVEWVNNAKERWGSRFLGIYLFDEPGGKQIDLALSNNETVVHSKPANYADAATAYVTTLGSSRNIQDLKKIGMPVFTSDYALYWFDYLAGYDTVFVEIGGTRGESNQTNKIQQIGLCRGAANVQNKTWGAIITWANATPPYLENGTMMLQDMQMAYLAGAKYIIVFNYPVYPDTNPYGILTEKQFDAMRNFWNQIYSDQKSTFGTENGQVALVLPKDYDWGMRNRYDLIWGFWNSDSLSPMISPIIWNNMDQLTRLYGLRLDVIYNDTAFNYVGKYARIYYWNANEEFKVPG